MPNNLSKTDFHNFGFTPQEKQIPVLPSGIASILLLGFMMFNGIFSPSEYPIQDAALILYCILNSLYLGYFHFILIPSPHLKTGHVWAYAIIQVTASMIVTLLLPSRMDAFLSGLMILLCITASIIADRKPATFILIGMTGAIFFLNLQATKAPAEIMRLLGTVLIAGVINEAIFQLKNLASRNINQLKIINDFSRQITASLETNQVLTWLNTAIPNTLQADSYFFGLVEGDTINISLLYDDGEYFKNFSRKLSGSLSGWVVENKKELFLPDLRRDIKLAGVDNVIIGQDKTSLSWMGVPINGLHVQGIIALASYRPNAFDRSDLELMNNIAQHAALALDNAFHHTQVEEQSHIDSLTGVYNHGYFLSLLKKYIQEARADSSLLSLIMLDVDYFKQYNDSYGHLAGDEILTALCKTITKHVKRLDIVGRWGGEEFVIALPGASGKQALQVAMRIHKTMATVKIKSMRRRNIPPPTLSQGIAQFPEEADEIMKLVDLADRRLYIAKERGRDQIEPTAEHWKKLS